jgi:O-antigen ligase
VAGIAKTGSRGGFVGLIVVGIILIVQGVRKRRWAYVLGIVGSAAAFALTASDELTTRFNTLLEPEADYNVTDREGRIEVWKRGMGLMLAHPFFGIGLDGFETAEGTVTGKVNEGYGVKYTAAHNAFVQIGAELGVVGLLAFVTAFASGAAGCRRALRVARLQRQDDPHLADQDARLAAALLCAVVAIACTGFFLSFAYHPLTLFMFAACTGVSARAPHRRRLVAR